MEIRSGSGSGRECTYVLVLSTASDWELHSGQYSAVKMSALTVASPSAPPPCENYIYRKACIKDDSSFNSHMPRLEGVLGAIGQLGQPLKKKKNFVW